VVSNVSRTSGAEIAPPSPASAPAAKWRRLGLGGADRSGLGLCRTPFGHHRFPVIDELRGAAVNLHPGEGISKDVAMGECAFRACAGSKIG
jgi:hypothetical protein